MDTTAVKHTFPGDSTIFRVRCILFKTAWIETDPKPKQFLFYVLDSNLLLPLDSPGIQGIQGIQDIHSCIMAVKHTFPGDSSIFRVRCILFKTAWIETGPKPRQLLFYVLDSNLLLPLHFPGIQGIQGIHGIHSCIMAVKHTFTGDSSTSVVDNRHF